MNKSNEIIKIFEDANDKAGTNTPLSINTVRKLAGIRHRQALAAIHEAMNAGRLRRVNPQEVGSNKFNSKPLPTHEEWIKYEKEVKTIINKKDKKTTEVWNLKIPKKERHYIHKTMWNERKFNVFALVQ